MATPDRSPEPSRNHAHRQDVLADVSQLALSSDDLDELFRETASAVRTALAADYCAVFERSASGDALAVRGGSGWHDRADPAVVSIADSQVGAAVGATAPVVVDDLGAASRFSPPDHFVEHGVASGVSVGIGCPDDPWGVLGAYATEEGAFADDDATFLANVANVLSSAVENARTKRRLRVEETIRERIVETSPIGILQVNAAGEIEFANERAAEILGRDRRRLESMSNDDADWRFVDANGDPLPHDAVPSERVLRDGNPLFGVDVGLRSGTGERIRLSVNANPLRDESGAVTGAVLALEDVTERREMERDRRETTESLKRLHAIASDRARSFDEKVDRLLELGRDRLGLDVGYLARVDADADRFEVTHASGESEHVAPGAAMALSETYCRLVVESDDLLAFADSPPEAIDDVYDVWEIDCYIGGRVTVDGDLYGTLCFEAPDARPRPFGAAERTFVELAIQWLSYELERERRSERLERYREYTDDIFDAIDDVFYVVDEHGDLRRWNESGRRVTGYTDAEIGSMNALEFFDEADAAAVADAIAEAFDTGSASVEAGLRTSDGEHVDYEFVASALENPAGEPVLAGVGRDITDRLERERALEESNERLEGFAYAASHDLQEPLRMISSYLQLLEGRYADELDADAAEFIEFAVDGADRMQEMIDGLLAYSRVDTRGDPFEPVALDAVLADVREDLRVKIEECDAEISVGRGSVEDRTADGSETTGSLPRVYGDAGQLRGLFQNLLDNALTYHGDDPPRITVFAEKRDSRWAVSVRDRGVGIDPDDRERIFEVFDRLHTREEYDGTGIGLALCRRIVERHDGEIRVDSESGEGSTFTVTLPTPPDTDTPPANQ